MRNIMLYCELSNINVGVQQHDQCRFHTDKWEILKSSIRQSSSSKTTSYYQKWLYRILMINLFQGTAIESAPVHCFNSPRIHL